MTLTEYLDAIAEKLGVNGLPDRLLTTYLKAFAQNQGVDVSALPDNLTTTYLSAIRNARGGQPVQDNLITTHLVEIAKTYGLEELPSNMISAYLEAIAAVADSGGGSCGGEPAELLSWEGVAYHINKGTYKDVYAIGDMVPLDLGSEGLINMQVAAFDTDKLADGSGTAAISWMAKELLATKRTVNVTAVKNDDGTYEDGTGAIGGWEKCELRSYFQNNIRSLALNKTHNQIVTVLKTHTAYDTNAQRFTQTTTDDVWIPSYKEMKDTTSLYGQLMSSTTNRIKFVTNTTTATNWWLRGSDGKNHSNYIDTTGGLANTYVTHDYGICLGFCTGRTPT